MAAALNEKPILSLHGEEAARLFRVDPLTLSSAVPHHGLGDALLRFLCCDILRERGIVETGAHTARYVNNAVLSQFLKQHFSVVGNFSAHSYGDFYERCLAAVYEHGQVSSDPEAPAGDAADRTRQCRALVGQLMRWVDENIPQQWVPPADESDESTLPESLVREAKAKMERHLASLVIAWKNEGEKIKIDDSNIAMKLPRVIASQEEHEMKPVHGKYSSRGGSSFEFVYFPCCGQRAFQAPEIPGVLLSGAKCALKGTDEAAYPRHHGQLMFPRQSRNSATSGKPIALWSCCPTVSIEPMSAPAHLKMFSCIERPCTARSSKKRPREDEGLVGSLSAGTLTAGVLSTGGLPFGLFSAAGRLPVEGHSLGGEGSV
jgi:hypothetical protein